MASCHSVGILAEAPHARKGDGRKWDFCIVKSFLCWFSPDIFWSHEIVQHRKHVSIFPWIAQRKLSELLQLRHVLSYLGLESQVSPRLAGIAKVRFKCLQQLKGKAPRVAPEPVDAKLKAYDELILEQPRWKPAQMGQFQKKNMAQIILQIEHETIGHTGLRCYVGKTCENKPKLWLLPRSVVPTNRDFPLLST